MIYLKTSEHWVKSQYRSHEKAVAEWKEIFSLANNFFIFETSAVLIKT
jgi:hypothetical protein